MQAAVRLGGGRGTRARAQLHVVFREGGGGGGSGRRWGPQLPKSVAGVGRRAAARDDREEVWAWVYGFARAFGRGTQVEAGGVCI